MIYRLRRVVLCWKTRWQGKARAQPSECELQFYALRACVFFHLKPYHQHQRRRMVNIIVHTVCMCFIYNMCYNYAQGAVIGSFSLVIWNIVKYIYIWKTQITWCDINECGQQKNGDSEPIGHQIKAGGSKPIKLCHHFETWYMQKALGRTSKGFRGIGLKYIAIYVYNNLRTFEFMKRKHFKYTS